MAGPLNGIGGQQVPLATPFQPGREAQVRPQQDDRAPKSDKIQPQGLQAAQSQATETRNTRDLQSLLKGAQSTDNGNGRGSVVDITV